MATSNTATELIALANAASASPELSYEPVWVNQDRRITDINKTTLKYKQVGGPSDGTATDADKIGNALGAIFKVEFVDLSALTATHIKIWGVHNNDASAVIYPVSYLDGLTLDVILNKFEFTNSGGTPVAAGGAYTIIGHRTNTQPFGI